jgi:hypothetical protein
MLIEFVFDESPTNLQALSLQSPRCAEIPLALQDVGDLAQGDRARTSPSRS